jgi:hypothetical protein
MLCQDGGRSKPLAGISLDCRRFFDAAEIVSDSPRFSSVHLQTWPAATMQIAKCANQTWQDGAESPKNRIFGPAVTLLQGVAVKLVDP